MSRPSVEDQVAVELVTARREGRSLPGFPGTAPASMTAAYEIQDAAMSRWEDTLVGWKIGYIPADRRAGGDPDRLVGPIWNRQCHQTGGHSRPVEVGIFASGFAAVEAELVVRLQQDVPAGEQRWSSDQAADLEQELLVGIEVASSPIPDINGLGPIVIAADFGNNNGLVLGPILGDRSGEAPIELACRIDGQLAGRGSSDDLPGGIHHSLATALNLLAGRGRPVRSGMVFATGAITGIHPVGPGQHCQVRVQGGPSVELRTADARTLLGR